MRFPKERKIGGLFVHVSRTQLTTPITRWQKISQAMQGRRTPRQVASRVQKYFEKLKRFGIGVSATDVGGDNEPA
jgi:hypothetical protein